MKTQKVVVLGEGISVNPKEVPSAGFFGHNPVLIQKEPLHVNIVPVNFLKALRDLCPGGVGINTDTTSESDSDNLLLPPDPEEIFEPADVHRIASVQYESNPASLQFSYQAEIIAILNMITPLVGETFIFVIENIDREDVGIILTRDRLGYLHAAIGVDNFLPLLGQPNCYIFQVFSNKRYNDCSVEAEEVVQRFLNKNDGFLVPEK